MTDRDDQSGASSDAPVESAGRAEKDSTDRSSSGAPTPNDAQSKLIDSTDGTYLVDAGAGTGKTFAITRRYAAIVDQPDVEPDDVLLATFTNSAATEMRERIVDNSTYSLRELADASIQTFHSLCSDLLREHGHRAPTHLGIDDRITDSVQVIEDDFLAAERFREFYDCFRRDHPEYADFYRVLSGPGDLQSVVSELASKGVFPTRDGWYRDGEAALDGERDAFEARLEELNRPRNGGSKQSELRSALYGCTDDKTHFPDAPSEAEIRGDGTKRASDAVLRDAFNEDRSELKAFVHDVYFAFLEFALSRNYLTFGFLQLFAFVLLSENRRVRESVGYDYLMVDEFQDTSEIQFQLALLLADTDNICVVGDWKQSIFAFQYADVENIREFEERLGRYVEHFDDDRIRFEPDEITTITLTENYRSTQSILDFSKHALTTPAQKKESVDGDPLGTVAPLASNAPFDESRIEGFAHEDQHEAVLSAIQEIVGNDEYAIEDDDGEPTAPAFEDVAVLTRTRDFGRELMAAAEPYSLPLAYDGGVELYRTDQAKLLLAWLRILESDNDRGWAAVLESAGYGIAEIEDMLDSRSYPAPMVAFRDTLSELETVGSVARRVFERYGFTDEYADVLLGEIQSLHDASTLTRGDLIRLIERGIEEGTTVEVTTSAGVDSVTVQTIHSAKGLEYPIVVLANMNDGKFPPRGGGDGVVRYQEPLGLRQRKQYADVEAHPHVYDNWTHDVLRHCVPDGYDEERRLLYVAMTRAEHHLVFAGGESPSTFFEELPFEERSIDPTVEPVDSGEMAQTQLPFSVVPPVGPRGYTPHSLMDDSVFEQEADDESGAFRGAEFGSRVHDFAEAYALGENVSPTTRHYDDERNVKEFLDGLTGELHVEERAVLPLTVGDERVTVSGIVDLVHETDDRIEIVDYKTDTNRRGETEYRKQLSVYYHVLTSNHPDKSVTVSIFYTASGERRDVEPLSKSELSQLVSTVD